MTPRQKRYCVNIPPQPWRRPQLCNTRFFNDQKSSRLAFGLYLAQQMDEDPLFDMPVHLDVTFYMPLPKSKYLRKPGQYHVITPDIDNLTKFCLDALKDVVITDDRIISSLSARKIYDRNPRTEFIITELV